MRIERLNPLSNSQQIRQKTSSKKIDSKDFGKMLEERIRLKKIAEKLKGNYMTDSVAKELAEQLLHYIKEARGW